MAFLATVKSITSCFVHSALRRSQESGQDQAQVYPQNALNEPNPSLPPLKPLDLPKILLEHHFALAEQGWTTITYDTPSDSLYDSSQVLLQASKAFFDLPQSYKEGFKTQIGSEEGWSRVEGEKEFITLRSLDNTPAELKDAASTYWREAGGLLNQLLGCIARSLGLPADALTVYSEPCTQLQPQKSATMLRLFRYEGFEGEQSKTVAEAHKDLGLLSLVIGDTPGLEVWDRHYQRWFQIERSYERPAGSLLVGRELERLSNGRYNAGGHLVRSYPNSPPQNPTKSVSQKYRYSIVFVLRAHSPMIVNTDNLTTPITGQFRNPLRDITAQELFRNIQKAHFNINTNIEERNEQRQKLAEWRTQEDQPAKIDDHNEKND